jgi:pimeloyl-ACP methyl ester carboxylesterase
MPVITIDSGGVALAADDDGEGVPVVLLHGLTATRRYVVMGSRSLERSGHRVVAYDARGHGESAPAPRPDAYGYDVLAGDLEAVLDELGFDRAVLAGASMGAHTIARFALSRPDRVAAAVFITPAFEPGRDEGLAGWDRLSDGLRRGGIEGFVEAYDFTRIPEDWHETVLKVIRQRLAQHENLDAVADALAAVPRSAPFDALDDLGRIRCPAIVVASGDEADPGHPFAVGERWAQALGDAELRTEEPGKSPLAWQGGQLSRIIAELADSVGDSVRPTA